MQVAEILSDLTSLRACDHDAALALVSSHKTSDSSVSQSPSKLPTLRRSSSPSASEPVARHVPTRGASELRTENNENDVDLQRAIDLVDLHYGVKMKHIEGLDKGLKKAREDVHAVLRPSMVDKENSRR
ncbi:hypothetical protein MMC20_005983 [Loxospora ochrophaea]|nr:hypothetical protein [Loxospora ochrophaea]